MPQPESVLHDLGLLLDPVGGERLSRLERVIVAAERVPVEDQIPLAARLGLPDMGQLVDQQTLPREGFGREILAIAIAAGVKVDMAERGHCDPPRLEREELAPLYPDPTVIDRLSEYAAREFDLAWR